MKVTAHKSGNPFKILKMINGEDVICKIAEEYSDAFVVEYPMAVVKNQVVEHEHNIVEHTGLQRWMNYTLDTAFVIPKERVYYKHIRKRLQLEEQHSPQDEEAAVVEMRRNLDRLMALIDDGVDLPEDTIRFDGDKTKLH